MKNNDYDNPFLIAKVVNMLQDRHPELGIGNYRKHTLHHEGKGFKVQLSNGTIVVTYDALTNVYDADEISDYTEEMIRSFVPVPAEIQEQQRRGRLRLDKFMSFFSPKRTQSSNK
jgi:hypothetical protein